MVTKKRSLPEAMRKSVRLPGNTINLGKKYRKRYKFTPSFVSKFEEMCIVAAYAGDKHVMVKMPPLLRWPKDFTMALEVCEDEGYITYKIDFREALDYFNALGMGTLTRKTLRARMVSAGMALKKIERIADGSYYWDDWESPVREGHIRKHLERGA